MLLVHVAMTRAPAMQTKRAKILAQKQNSVKTKVYVEKKEQKSFVITSNAFPQKVINYRINSNNYQLNIRYTKLYLFLVMFYAYFFHSVTSNFPDFLVCLFFGKEKKSFGYSTAHILLRRIWVVSIHCMNEWLWHHPFGFTVSTIFSFQFNLKPEDSIFGWVDGTETEAKGKVQGQVARRCASTR